MRPVLNASTSSLRAQRSNPESLRGDTLDCFAALAMTAQGVTSRLISVRLRTQSTRFEENANRAADMDNLGRRNEAAAGGIALEEIDRVGVLIRREQEVVR